MFRVALWKRSTYSIKLPIGSAICSSYFLISPGVDSLWLESVFKFILWSVTTSHRITHDFDVSIDGHLSDQVPGIVEDLFPLRPSPGLEVSKSEKAWGFVNDKFVNST